MKPLANALGSRGRGVSVKLITFNYPELPEPDDSENGGKIRPHRRLGA
jgi:hypothetical protein